MSDEYLKKLARRMAVGSAIVVPLGIIVAAAIGGKGVLAGTAVGFGVALINSALVLVILAWALKRSLQWLPSLLMASYLLRVIALAFVLYGLTRIAALSALALLISFLVLYVVLTTAEVVTAWQSFGATFGKSGGKQEN